MNEETKLLIKKIKSANHNLYDYLIKHRKMVKMVKKIDQEVQNLMTEYEAFVDFKNPENPFAEEKQLLEKTDKRNHLDLYKKAEISKLKADLENTKTGKDNDTNFIFYMARTRESEKRRMTLTRSFKSDLWDSFYERYNKWKNEQLEIKRGKYYEKLIIKIQNFMERESELELLADKDFGRMWDLSEGKFDNYGFDLIKIYDSKLQNDPSIKKLAEALGRQQLTKKKYQTETIENLKVTTDYITTKAYKGPVAGLTLSGNISSVLPKELGLYTIPETECYFEKQMLEKKLLSYSYKNRHKIERIEAGTEKIQVAYDEKDMKGPVIICVDTSGSMQGIPEQVAKTITYALTKICMNEKRNCYLISFSTDISVMDLSVSDKNGGLKNLVDFLNMSFYGGTDCRPALEQSLKLLKSESWEKADVLMVSDFCMGNLDSKLEKNIKDQQKKKTEFHSLVIGNSGNQATIACFDKNWVYDFTSSNKIKQIS